MSTQKQKDGFSLQYDASNALETYVAEWLIAQANEYSNQLEGVFKDLQHGGCASGYVSELIYSHDCRIFVGKYMVEIQELLNDMADNIGGEELGKVLFANSVQGAGFSFDRIAWVAFEETAYSLAGKNGY